MKSVLIRSFGVMVVAASLGGLSYADGFSTVSTPALTNGACGTLGCVQTAQRINYVNCAPWSCSGLTPKPIDLITQPIVAPVVVTRP